ncbi:FAD-dependent oxidoreductase [Spirillospora sp. CA-294931]|uniref:FAD-dependent oxidoreductase n=1 Tax=Spirillospora sp. CA-294931 TaxID=3240042 RepID=UPI003D8F75A6
MNADAVVCGAGAGGLAAACALGGLGLQVLLVEKQLKPRPIAKGEVLQPGALRILRQWGVAQRLERLDAVRLAQLVARDPFGQSLMALDYHQLNTDDPWLLAHDHPTILAALADSLPANVEVRRGVLVERPLRADDGRVLGVRLAEDGRGYDVHAALVVAADGVSSRLRRAIGIDPRRAEYPHRLVSFDVSDAPETPNAFTAYVAERGLRLCYPLPGGRVRLYAQVKPDELRGADAARLARWARGLLDEVPALKPLTDPLMANLDARQLFPVGRFLTPRLAAPGLALLGESAHAVHPMAAQGMNSSIADAECLARAVASHGTTDDALRAYQRERLPNLVHIGRMSHNAAVMLTDTSWRGRLLGRRAARNTGANPRLRRIVTFNMSGLGVHTLTPLDRLHQIGLLPDPRAHDVPTK